MRSEGWEEFKACIRPLGGQGWLQSFRLTVSSALKVALKVVGVSNSRTSTGKGCTGWQM